MSAVIEPSSIGSKPITLMESDIKIEMLTEPPVTGKMFRPRRPPGQLCGYYNGNSNLVELFVVNSNGERFLKVA